MAWDTDPDQLVTAAIAGDRRALARLLTLVENGSAAGGVVVSTLFPRTGEARIVGMTGAPGAGKSTITDGLISRARAAGGEIAVVAIDPSSPYTGGAILGDRIRMQGHIADQGVYIRSMASRGHLGGLAAATPKAVAVLDAVGFPTVVVETVGVGQAEVAVAGDADTTIVVVTPGWGDGIQAAKAGLLEIGDVFVVNKADRSGADAAVRDLEQMLDLGAERAWRPPVLRTVATKEEGLDEVWAAIADHRRYMEAGGELAKRRTARLRRALDEAVAVALVRRAESGRGDVYRETAAAVEARRVDPWSGAEAIAAAVDEAQRKSHMMNPPYQGDRA